MNKHMERTQVYLPKGLKKLLQDFAYEDETNFSAVLREAAQSYVAKRMRDKKKHKEAFLKALQNSSGIWQDRPEMDFDAIRGRSNRMFKGED